MSERDHTDAARREQGYFGSFVSELVEVLKLLFPPPPIEPHHFYTRKEAMRRLRIGNGTWAEWVRDGLPVRKRGKSTQYIYGEDLIRFIGGEHATGKARSR